MCRRLPDHSTQDRRMRPHEESLVLARPHVLDPVFESLDLNRRVRIILYHR